MITVSYERDLPTPEAKMEEKTTERRVAQKQTQGQKQEPGRGTPVEEQRIAKKRPKAQNRGFYI
jgi:hypothetical protein